MEGKPCGTSVSTSSDPTVVPESSSEQTLTQYSNTKVDWLGWLVLTGSGVYERADPW